MAKPLQLLIIWLVEQLVACLLAVRMPLLDWHTRWQARLQHGCNPQQRTCTVMVHKYSC